MSFSSEKCNEIANKGSTFQLYKERSFLKKIIKKNIQEGVKNGEMSVIFVPSLGYGYDGYFHSQAIEEAVAYFKHKGFHIFSVPDRYEMKNHYDRWVSTNKEKHKIYVTWDKRENLRKIRFLYTKRINDEDYTEGYCIVRTPEDVVELYELNLKYDRVIGMSKLREGEEI